MGFVQNIPMIYEVLYLGQFHYEKCYFFRWLNQNETLIGEYIYKIVFILS
jgi:hypothetical protein